MPSDHRFSRAVLARSLGGFLALAGVLLVLLAVLVAVLDAPAWVLTTAVVTTLVVALAGGLLVVRGVRLVRFDDTGYQVRLLRGAGVKQARWQEVEDAVTANVSGHDCVVLRLRDGRTTTIPVAVLDTDRDAFVAELTARLDQGHGYRRLR